MHWDLLKPTHSMKVNKNIMKMHMPKPSAYEIVAMEIAKMVAEKNIAYGDSFGNSAKLVKVLYPNGIKPEQYDDFLCLIRVIDKLFRIATRKRAFGESPWKDILGYSLLAIVSEEKSDVENKKKKH